MTLALPLVLASSAMAGAAQAPATPDAPVFHDPEAVKQAARLALDIRALEELGGYRQAAEKLRELRPLVLVDADLDLWLAIDLARAGRADTALTMLYGPVLSAALNDTTDSSKFRIYGWRHERTYFGGRFDGWYWYIARARFELEAARGHWAEALAAARICTRARPLAGSEWYLLALGAAHAGAVDEARTAVARALRLAPVLPEVRYLSGVLEWRDGHRAGAEQRFRRAVELDSAYRAPAIALGRIRASTPPDSLPSRLLGGLREAALVTSRARPKYDEFIQLEQPPVVTHRVDVMIPDSLESRVKAITVNPLALFDTTGHVVYHEDPWAAATSAPEALVGLISSSLLEWTVSPAIMLGHPQAVWLELDVNLKKQ